MKADVFTGHQEPLSDHEEQSQSPFDQMMDALNKIANREGTQPTLEQNLLLDEYMAVPNGTSLVLDPNIDRPAMITSMIVSIPVGATGILTIGTPGTGADRRIINITPTQPPFNGIQMVIYPADIVTLTSTSAGFLFVEIMGGILRGTDWRVI